MRFAATVVAEGVAAKSTLTILCQENFFQLFNLKLFQKFKNFWCDKVIRIKYISSNK